MLYFLTTSLSKVPTACGFFLSSHCLLSAKAVTEISTEHSEGAHQEEKLINTHQQDATPHDVTVTKPSQLPPCICKH